jgi:hypothetical protein
LQRGGVLIIKNINIGGVLKRGERGDSRENDKETKKKTKQSEAMATKNRKVLAADMMRLRKQQLLRMDALQTLKRK